MLPRTPRAIMRLAAAWLQKNTFFRLTSTIRS